MRMSVNGLFGSLQCASSAASRLPAASRNVTATKGQRIASNFLNDTVDANMMFSQCFQGSSPLASGVNLFRRSRYPMSIPCQNL